MDFFLPLFFGSGYDSEPFRGIEEDRIPWKITTLAKSLEQENLTIMTKRSIMTWIFMAAIICSLFPVRPVPAQTNEAAPKVAEKNDYSQPSTWLCRPGRQDACAVDLASTVIAPDGTLTREDWTANPEAPIDCFYVYPTVSRDPTPNSDMIAGPEEKSAIQQQFARFGSQCRVYAPLYRQVTLTALWGGMTGKPMPFDIKLNYNDIRDAWNFYLRHDNKGRGVVLIGHSQGSGVLTQLIQNEIEGQPIQSQILSALLLGSRVQVPPNKEVGGTFKHMPLCRKAGETGCIITYASFRSTAPPPENSLFGRGRGDTVAACTNPAALSGGSGALQAYLASRTRMGSTPETFAWVTPKKEIQTPFVSLPGLLTGQCVSNKHGAYLEITVHGDPGDPRTDDIPGDVLVGGRIQADWGLHLIDVNLAMGNLIDIVGRQAKSYLEAKKVSP
jgi:hypothetical protein